MYVNQVIGFTYGGYVYQWDKKLAVFTPNGKIPFKYPLFFSNIPNEAREITITIYRIKGGNET